MEVLYEMDHIFLEPRELWEKIKVSELGSVGEAFVLNFLIDKGFKRVASHLRERPFAEVDLVVEKEGLHYFVEVKTRRNSEIDEVVEGILTPRQYARLMNAAELYSMRKNVSVQLCLALLSIQDKGEESRLALRFLPLL